MINIIYKQYNSTLFISLILIFLLILFSLKYSFYLYLFFIIISNILFYLFDKKNIFYFFFLSIIVINILYLSFYNNIIENYGTNKNNPTETIEPYCNELISDLENKYDNIIKIVKEGSEKELRKYYELFHHHDRGSKITSEKIGIITPQIEQLLEAYARQAEHKRLETEPIINIEQMKLNTINQLERWKKFNVERFTKYCINYNKQNLKRLKLNLRNNIEYLDRIHS